MAACEFFSSYNSRGQLWSPPLILSSCPVQMWCNITAADMSPRSRDSLYNLHDATRSAVKVQKADLQSAVNGRVFFFSVMPQDLRAVRSKLRMRQGNTHPISERMLQKEIIHLSIFPFRELTCGRLWTCENEYYYMICLFSSMLLNWEKKLQTYLLLGLSYM